MRPLLLIFLVACGSSKPAPTPGPGNVVPDAAPGVVVADAAPASACDPDAPDCCQLPDGEWIVFGCQPVNRAGDPPNHTKNPDGTCGQCMLRCLPPAAQIATPSGDRAISSLAVGDVVWTVDASGARVAAPILAIRPLAAPSTHVVLRLTLDDGRAVTASGGHPTADGRELLDLSPGSQLDGATVLSIDALPLDGDATWDLLPAGDTGAYWADGVLLGSTLSSNGDGP